MENSLPSSSGPVAARLPRVTIQFCTQCKWMLRAAYYAQELLSTFSTTLGEVALQPSTGGTFVVTIITAAPGQDGIANSLSPIEKCLWDRKIDGGFPETKELKRRVRDVIAPERDLGHVDKDYGKQTTSNESRTATIDSGDTDKQEREQISTTEAKGTGQECEDCK